MKVVEIYTNEFIKLTVTNRPAHWDIKPEWKNLAGQIDHIQPSPDGLSATIHTPFVGRHLISVKLGNAAEVIEIHSQSKNDPNRLFITVEKDILQTNE